MNDQVHHLTGQVSNAVAQHKIAVETIIASTGIGATVASWIGWLQPVIGLAIAVLSLYLLVLRIRIARKELDKPE